MSCACCNADLVHIAFRNASIVHLARSLGIVRASEPAFSPRRRPSDEFPVNFPDPKNDSLFGAKDSLFRAEQGIRRKAVKLLGK